MDNKPVVLLYFATWCEPCLKEIEHLKKVKKTLAAKIYLINIDNLPREKIIEFVKENAIDFSALLDPNAELTCEKFGVLKGGAAKIPKTSDLHQRSQEKIRQCFAF